MIKFEFRIFADLTQFHYLHLDRKHAIKMYRIQSIIIQNNFEIHAKRAIHGKYNIITFALVQGCLKMSLNLPVTLYYHLCSKCLNVMRN